MKDSINFRLTGKKCSFWLSRFIPYVGVLLFLLSHLQGHSQSSSDSARIELITVAHELITDARYCALISLDDEGRAHPRAMDPFLPEKDFTIWFGTNPNSRKVRQIQNDSNVTLYYLAKDDSGYVSIYGKAEIVNDFNFKKKYFKESWQAFYPNYPEEYRLIKFTPEWMEVISIPHGINGDRVTWTPPLIKFDEK